MKQDRLLELLLSMGMIENDAAQRAMIEHGNKAGEMGRILLDLNLIQEETLVRAYSSLYSIPAVTLRPSALKAEVAKILPKEICEKHLVIPFKLDTQQQKLHVAMSDPTNLDLTDEVRRSTRLTVVFFLASRTSISTALTYCFYGDNLSNLGGEVNMFESNSLTADPISLGSSSSTEDDAAPQAIMGGANNYADFQPNSQAAPPPPSPGAKRTTTRHELMAVQVSRTGAMDQDGPHEIQIELESQDHGADGPQPPPPVPDAARAQAAPAAPAAPGTPAAPPSPSPNEIQAILERMGRLQEAVTMNRLVLERLLRLLISKGVISRDEAIKAVESE